MREFILDSEYIELVKLLKLIGIAETGGHAKMLVGQGEVLLNGEPEYRKRAKLRMGDQVEVFGEQIQIRSAE
ncbi:MAG TPA: RNA-binding S4 domain-containing protein [Mariniphaga anaerophila]|uniref:RNA-binding S4 domain-containing protein n=1 Tax=Mariniphaga anaerophila TaxID=1484053 RepID=A0A831LNZ8_9BACT|nr:RNA-binding S4 domain-containing protein [Mariniphaga anaerophila]